MKTTTSSPTEKNFPSLIEKIEKIKEQIETFEIISSKILYHSGKKNESLKRSDFKISELLNEVNVDLVSIDNQDNKIITQNKHFIDNCGFKTILQEMAKKTKTIFIDIGHSYLMHAIDIMRKLSNISKNEGNLTQKILIYPDDNIDVSIMNEFLKYFFILNNEQKINLFSIIKLEYIPKIKRYEYTPKENTNVTFLTSENVNKLVKRTNRQQQKIEKALSRQLTYVPNSFFIDSGKDDNFLTDVFDTTNNNDDSVEY